MSTMNDHGQQLKEAVKSYLAEHPECEAVVVEPSGEMAQIIQGSDAIRGYLSGLKDGRPMTPRSWFGETEDAGALLEQVKSIVNSTSINSPYADVIKQHTLSYESKYGEQGGTPPLIETLPTIFAGFQKFSHTINFSIDPIWNQAKGNLVKRYNFTKTLKPWSYQRVVEDKREKGRITRYAGFPTGGKKSEPSNIDKAIRDAESGKCFQYPAMILFRYYKGKLRMVWMYPFSMTLRGASYESALMNHLRKLKLPEFAPWEGFDDVKVAITDLWNPKDEVAFGGDTSAMDDHMQLDQNLEAFDVLKYAFEERYWTDLKEIIVHENDIPLLISPDCLITGWHGKASGADFTQLTETIFQAIVQEYIRLQTEEWRWFIAQGDDYVTGLHGIMKYADLMVTYYEKAGLPGKVEKQSDESGYVTFLQRLFCDGWKARGRSEVLGGIYSVISALRSLVYPENWVDPDDYPGHFSDMFCVKVCQIVENCVDSPFFESFVKWAGPKQKDIIPFAKKSKAQLDAIWKASQSVRGIGESYNQEKMNKPISTYECVKIWRTM